MIVLEQPLSCSAMTGIVVQSDMLLPTGPMSRLYPLVSFPSSEEWCLWSGGKRNLSWIPFTIYRTIGPRKPNPINPNASQASIFNQPDHISIALLDVNEGYNGLTVH